ncbi:MAG: NFACT RNA binding domain-containing protein [Bacteroidia bacterium]
MKDLVLSHFTTWYFLKAIKPYILGAKLVDAYTVSKEQTIFVFDNNGEVVHLLFYFSGYNAFYWAQSDYGKPRSKYNTKYKSLFGRQLNKIIAFENERSFALVFDDYSLFFGLFGRSNFIQKMDNQNNTKWQVELPGFGIKSFEITEKPNISIDFIKMVYGKTLNIDALAKKQVDIEKAVFTVSKNDNEKIIFGFNEQNALLTTDDIFEALKFYSKTWFKTFHFSHTYQKLKKHFLVEKKKLDKSLIAAEKQAERVKNDLNYRQWADLLMANLHSLTPGQKKVSLLNFLGNKQVDIPLKTNLNIQENAAQYYRKAKNQGKELEILESRIDKLFDRLEHVEYKIIELSSISDIKALLILEKEIFLKNNTTDKTKRFIEFEIDGYKVYVGRNSKNNDELTLGFAGKNDLWLHAKDLAGSHVVIRNKGSQTTYPKQLVEQVACIAAYYSKGRNQEFCPVLYTLKKYIRKPKGAVAGAVLVDREDVVLVRPSLPKV